MTPSVWSVLLIFVLAPIGVAGLVTVVVLLVASPVRRPLIVALGEAAEAEKDDVVADDVANCNGHEPGQEEAGLKQPDG